MDCIWTVKEAELINWRVITRYNIGELGESYFNVLIVPPLIEMILTRSLITWKQERN